jgi:hypothetical protein
MATLEPPFFTLQNLDCCFTFDEARWDNTACQFALPMAAALYCALTGATAKPKLALIGAAVSGGRMWPAPGGLEPDILDFVRAQDVYHTVVMELGTATRVNDSLPISRSAAARRATIVGAEDYMEGIRAAVNAPVGEHSQLVAVPPTP